MDYILKSYNEVLNSISIQHSIKIYYQKIIQLLDKTTFFQNHFLQWISFTLENKILSLNFYETNFKLNHPDKILGRGFTMVKNNKNEIIQRVEKLKIKDKININFLDGTATAEVKNIEKADEKK